MDVPGNMQGASLVPLMKGEVKEVREEIFYEAPESNLGSYPLYAIRTKEWKYIQTYDLQDPGTLIFEEIYYLTDDPHEMNNLTGDKEVEELRDQFARKIDWYRRELKSSPDRMR
jgi:arylsulfatase A-like enzyme